MKTFSFLLSTRVYVFTIEIKIHLMVYKSRDRPYKYEKSLKEEILEMQFLDGNKTYDEKVQDTNVNNLAFFSCCVVLLLLAFSFIVLVVYNCFRQQT